MQIVFRLYFCAIIALSANYCLGQDLAYSSGLIPPSPNSASFAQYSETPVNLYTGIPGIAIPIYTLSSKSLNVPISLSYHASGNRVDDIPGWVGLGWTLNAGGGITRVVKGLPDEDANGFCGLNRSGKKVEDFYKSRKYGTSIDFDTSDFKNKVATGELDSEPDVFY
ncbi:MAG: hypothetical protein K2Q22_16290, partial [Cytophagales bacterium]|nr:hypothetical protein [Cytophagales bacterium]